MESEIAIFAHLFRSRILHIPDHAHIPGSLSKRPGLSLGIRTGLRMIGVKTLPVEGPGAN
jgi:hypothetical protein